MGDPGHAPFEQRGHHPPQGFVARLRGAVEERRMRRLRRRLSEHFDAAHYLRANPDVAAQGLDPLAHFLTHGHDEGRDPGPEFSVSYYLAANPDVRAARRNALVHYALAGRAEGRRTMENPAVLGTVRPEFDRAFYRGVYPEIGDADPLMHFLAFGWRERRDPNHWFSTGDYLDANPDVAASGVNPFHHYLTVGRLEGRACAYAARRPAGWTATERSPEPLDGRTRADLDAPSLTEADLQALLDDARSDCHGLVVCLVGGDGATDAHAARCRERDVASAKANGWRLLEAVAGPCGPGLAAEGADPSLALFLDGEASGSAATSSLVAGLVRGAGDGPPLALLMRGLGGHSPERLAVLSRARPAAAIILVDDYALLCVNGALMRNGASYCAAPPPRSGACRICVFGEERQSHLTRLRTFFDALPFAAIAPSREAADLVATRSPSFSAGTVDVHAPARIGAPREAAHGFAAGAARVAIIGPALPREGFDVFARIARREAWNGRYTFHRFGEGRSARTRGSTEVPHWIAEHALETADGRPADARAIADGLVREAIDVVVVWPASPHPFSFAALAAAAAGCAVVTRSGPTHAGEAAAAAPLCMVLDDGDSLDAAFAQGEILTLCHRLREAPRTVRDIEHVSAVPRMIEGVHAAAGGTGAHGGRGELAAATRR